MAPVRNLADRCPLRRSTGRLERLSRSCAQHTDDRLGHLRVLYESRDVSLLCEPKKSISLDTIAYAERALPPLVNTTGSGPRCLEEGIRRIYYSSS